MQVAAVASMAERSYVLVQAVQLPHCTLLGGLQQTCEWDVSR
jgi:hypothetical protein